MIVSPEWTTLKGVALGLDSPDPVRRKQALQHTLETITNNLPDVHAVRLYEVDGQTLVVQAATDLPDHAVKKLADLPDLTPLAAQQASTWDPEAGQWVCPLVLTGQLVGAFEVRVEALDADWITWLEIIAAQVGPPFAMHRLQPTADDTQEIQLGVRSRAKRLVKAAQMLSTSEEYDEVATAAMYVLDDARAAMVTIFDQPLLVQDKGADGVTNNSRYVAALATSTQATRLDANDTLGAMPELSYVNNLRQATPIVIDNIQTEAGYLMAWMREQALEHQAQQVISLPLLTSEQVIGTLDLLYDSPQTLSEDMMAFYMTLAAQIGDTILSKRLLQRSLAAQEFATQLVSTNKSLAVAEDYNEMAQAVLNDAPDSVFAVSIALFNRPFTLMGSPVRLSTRAVVTPEGVLEEQFTDHFSAQEDARVTYFLHEFLEGRMMMLWNIQRPRTPVMAETLVSHLQMIEGVAQVTAFGLNVRNSLLGLVVFAGDATLRDPGPQYDGLRAIADQLAAVIENRNLLQQTSEALDLIQSQYETSSRVFRTNNLSEILQAFVEFAGGVFSHAELAWTDALGVTRVLAEVSPEGSHEPSRGVELSDYPASATLSVLEALEIRDVEEDAFVDEDEREALQARGVRSLVLLPIVSDFTLRGVISLANDKPVRVIPDRLRALRSLADQVGVVLQNRNLLQSMELNLEEIQLLYEANRAMLRTQDTMDVLRVLRATLAPGAAALCQVGIEYDVSDRNHVTGIFLDYEITEADERVLHQLLPTTHQERRGIYDFLRGVQDRVLFSPQGAALPSNPVSLLQERYVIASYATLVVKDRGQVSSLIYLLFDEARTFPENTRRLYQAIGDQVGIAIDNQKLLRESQAAAETLGNQVKALQTISGLAVELSNVKDETSLLRTSVRALVEALKLDHSGLVLFNEDMQTGVVVSEYPEGDYLGVTVSTKDNPLLMPDHEPNQPVVIEDVTTTSKLTDEMREVFQRGNVRSVIIVPLVGQDGELIGSVGLDVYDTPRQFTATELQTAQTIAAQLAVGLQNIRLLEDAQTRAEQLQSISDFSGTVQSTLDLDALVDAALANLPRLLPVDHVTIALYDENDNAMMLVGGWTENNTFRTPLDTGGNVPLKGTTTGQVYETGEYLYMPNMQRTASLHYPHSRTVTSLLAMPLRTQGRTIGVISAGSYVAGAYTDTDIAVFQQMVNQMAVAMDNARTYTQSQEIARNKTLANDIALKLQRQGSIQQMIDLTMQEVGQAIGAKRGRLHLRTDPPESSEPKNETAE